MKLFSRFKNLFVPREEEKSSRKATKKIKKIKKKKIKIKPNKKALKKKKMVIKKKTKKSIKKKIRKKVKKKIGPKVKKGPSKKRFPKKKLPKSLKKIPEEKEIGIVTHYFGRISVGIIKLKSTLRVKERIHIKGAHDDFTQTIKSMQINHKDVSMAGKGSEIGIKVPQPVHENDRVYRV